VACNFWECARFVPSCHTPWKRTVLEELVVPQRITFPEVYWTLRFIIFFTESQNWRMYWVGWIRSIHNPISLWSVILSTPTHSSLFLNLLTPNVNYSGRTAPLTSSCFLYIYSTNIGTEYFKRGVYSPFSSLQNAVCFIILTYLVPVLFTFYI